MRTKFAAILTLLLSVPLSGQTWSKQPVTFRGAKFGSSEKEAKEKWEAEGAKAASSILEDCFDFEQNSLALRRCPLTNLDLGGGVLTTVQVYFYEDRFSGVTAAFASADYENIREALITRYGRPTSVSHPRLQNLMGAKATNEILMWSGARMRASLYRFNDTFAEGSFNIGTQRFNRSLDQAEKKAKTASRKPLIGLDIGKGSTVASCIMS